MSISIDVEAVFGPNKTFGTLRYQKNTYAPCSGLFGRTNGPEKPMGNSMPNLHDFFGPPKNDKFDPQSAPKRTQKWPQKWARVAKFS